MTIAGVAVSGIFWISGIQFQVNQNTTDLAAWKAEWRSFTQAREITVRNYEQRMTTQEQSNKEILRRLDSIAEDLRRIQPTR